MSKSTLKLQCIIFANICRNLFEIYFSSFRLGNRDKNQILGWFWAKTQVLFKEFAIDNLLCDLTVFWVFADLKSWIKSSLFQFTSLVRLWNATKNRVKWSSQSWKKVSPLHLTASKIYNRIYYSGERSRHRNLYREIDFREILPHIYLRKTRRDFFVWFASKTVCQK